MTLLKGWVAVKKGWSGLRRAGLTAWVGLGEDIELLAGSHHAQHGRYAGHFDFEDVHHCNDAGQTDAGDRRRVAMAEDTGPGNNEGQTPIKFLSTY